MGVLNTVEISKRYTSGLILFLENQSLNIYQCATIFLPSFPALLAL